MFVFDGTDVEVWGWMLIYIMCVMLTVVLAPDREIKHDPVNDLYIIYIAVVEESISFDVIKLITKSLVHFTIHLLVRFLLLFFFLGGGLLVG